MKRVCSFLLILLLILSACSAPKNTELPRVLVSADGETLLTRTDFLFARAYEGISASGEKANRKLFLRIAAEAVCLRIAEEQGENESYDEIAAELNIYLQNNADAEEIRTLRESLSELTEEEFRQAFLSYHYRTASVDALLKSIASVYGNVQDPEAIREGILANLWELSEQMEISLYYPDLEDPLNFEDVL